MAFRHTYRRKGNGAFDVLASTEALATYDGGSKSFGGDHVLDASDCVRVGECFIAPRVEAEAHGGWSVECCAVYGWVQGGMRNKQTLVRLRYGIDRDFTLTSHVRTLSKRMFSSVPKGRY